MLSVFLGIAFCLFFYFSIRLIPIYPLGLIAFLGFGISLHAFIPLVFTVTILIYLFKKVNRPLVNFTGFGAGIVLSLLIVTFFIFQWHSTTKLITRLSDQSVMNEKNILPNWVEIAKQLPKNSISEKILKTDLVYSTPQTFNWDFFNLPSQSFDEVKKHDPLISIAVFFAGEPVLTTDEKINILQAMYDSRHKAQERLWTGENLQTSHVITNVRIFPNLRIAYTEKIIDVHNSLYERAWTGRQEAIYTFHLPEGSVVTSLSLWMNGKEEKAILTSKQKADTAYRTIVGQEYRDPSLVRWQEGNTVSVRIFPCTPGEDRRFKIGITSPLRNENSKLFYENIWFDGPLAKNADESIKIRTMDDNVLTQLPKGFSETSPEIYQYNGSFRAYWEIGMIPQAILPNTFSFDKKSYHISDYQKSYETFVPKDIYLDVNSSWSKEEFNRCLDIFKNQDVYVFSEKLVKVTQNNSNSLFDQLHKFNFSMFPFFKIKNISESILISKSSETTPNLNDIKESEFAEKLKEYLLNKPAIRLYNLGYEVSPFLKTMKELRIFIYDNGSLSDLDNLIKSKKFVLNQETSQSVVIYNAKIKITESNDTAQSNAPDHLMRLFTYNSIMKQIGKNYLENNFNSENIVEQGHKSYIVTPVTSLVVLETKQDYQRFHITDEGKSLQNASLKSAGAVPEPHEWLLITVLVGLLLYLNFKKPKIVTLRQAQGDKA